MTPDTFPAIANELCGTCSLFGQRGWCRATSGNFSARVDDSHCMITRSGREKSALTMDGLMISDLHGNPLDPACKSSAETPLHTLLYRLDSDTGAVLHTHSVTSTVLSRASSTSIEISGFEMQKAMKGQSTHDATLSIPIFENNQDMQELADTVERAWNEQLLGGHGFIIRGHGLYAWGAGISEAQRHVEGLEFLFECIWQERLASR